MAKVALLGVLWIGSIVGLATAREVVNCGARGCNSDVKAVVQGPQDVDAVIRKHAGTKNVDFHGNLLTKFIEGYSRPRVQWERLNLSYNLLEADVFQNLQGPQLKVIDITYNQLERVTVPPSVVEFIAERNKLHSITIQARSLKRLILPKNKFDSLRDFSNLPQLTELDLSCNQLEKLNLIELSSMRQLKTLKVANNHIHVIEGTNSMRTLEYLDISNNILTTVDESFNNFPSVKTLYLQGNRIVMWMKEVTIDRSIQLINIENNDWDCNTLTTIVKPRLNYKFVRGSDTSKCITAESPYADRLIKYRKQEFKALQQGTAQREGNISCDSYVPSPCDGDDNRVYEVAGSAVQSAQDLAKQDVVQLQQTLAREENAVRTIQDQITAAQQENSKLTDENNELAGYIQEEYQKAGLSGDADTIAQLNKIFEHYEEENTRLKQEINAEEVKNQDKLNEINTLQNEIDDETYRKEKLQEEFNKRNQTVMGYEKKIADLQKQLEARG